MISSEITAFAKIAQSAQDFSDLDFGHSPNWEIFTAKNGSLSAKDGTLLLHSSYNPEREAQSAVNAESQKKGAGVFFAPALGYAVTAFCASFPERAVVVVEPSVRHLLASFCVTDWSKVFSHKDCVFAVGAEAGQVVAILESFGLEDAQIFSQKSQTAHFQSYFDSLSELIKRNLKKIEINNSTLSRFGKLWSRNSTRNLRDFAYADGIARFKDCAKMKNGDTLPFVVFAAGPSLGQILPHLSEIKKRAIVICVDTALRSCLACGVEPDFIVIVDPQYWAFRHIAGLSSPSSVLIAEGAVYPAALRFDCKKIVMGGSLFPLGKYFEKKFFEKGELGAGGSVSTSAWDFARLSGAKEIFVAGLDLGFSSKNTHVKGSSSEESAHCASCRIQSAETSGVRSLFGANTVNALDYEGKPILTDDKMKMFAWWFESNIAKALDKGQKTYTLCPRNLALPGVSVCNIDDFLKKSEIGDMRTSFFESAEKNPCRSFKKDEFENCLSDFIADVKKILSLAEKKAPKQEFSCFEAILPSLFPVKDIFEKLKKGDSDAFYREIKAASSHFLKNINLGGH